MGIHLTNIALIFPGLHAAFTKSFRIGLRAGEGKCIRFVKFYPIGKKALTKRERAR